MSETKEEVVMSVDTTDRADDLEEMLCYSPAYVAEKAEMAIQSIYRYLDEDISGKSMKHHGKKWFPTAFRIGAKWMIPEEDVIRFLGHDPTKVKVRFVG